MDQKDLKQLAGIHLRAAKTLLDSGQFGVAYHLTGVAVECALKACIAKKARAREFPDKAFAQSCYTHDLTALRKLAGLDVIFGLAVASSPTLGNSWQIVKDWSIESRYEMKTGQEATDLYWAVHRQETGVMRWIRQHW